MESQEHFGGRLPPGCRQADLERGVSRLDDLSPSQLWRLLDEEDRARLYRRFFHDEWAELAEILEGESPSREGAMRSLWFKWRNAAVSRMAQDGLIQGER